MKIEKLIKMYDLNSDMQYFEMIVNSVINGQRTQAKNQFKKMDSYYKNKFIKLINTYWNSGLDESDKLLFLKPI